MSSVSGPTDHLQLLQRFQVSSVEFRDLVVLQGQNPNPVAITYYRNFAPVGRQTPRGEGAWFKFKTTDLTASTCGRIQSVKDYMVASTSPMMQRSDEQA